MSSIRSHAFITVACVGLVLTYRTAGRADVSYEGAQRAGTECVNRGADERRCTGRGTGDGDGLRGRSNVEAIAAWFIGRERIVGSGAILTSDGYVITNAHVVNAAERIRVVLHQPAGEDPLMQFLTGEAGRTVNARMIGTAHRNDLALLKVDETESGRV